MVVIKEPWVCAKCNGRLNQCDVVNQADWERDTYICDRGHLNFKKFDYENNTNR